VRIEPHLGNLKNISGEIPHPKGRIAVQYLYQHGKWIMEINLPSKITGSFNWKGRTYSLKEGKNSLQM
jgi:alpha-L-rhamnosidase